MKKLSDYHSAQEDYVHNPSDCILLVKHLCNSASLSQRPITLLPTTFAKLLEKPVGVLPRNLLVAERTARELLGIIVSYTNHGSTSSLLHQLLGLT